MTIRNSLGFFYSYPE